MKGIAAALATAVAGTLVTAVLSSAPATGADTLTVPVTTGQVRGLSLGTVDEWRGVPYAAPPVGALRWRPPAPVTPWSGVRDATQFAPPCLQQGVNARVEGSEDCLYLNVTAPSGAPSAARLPVMVHLYSAGNWFGAPHVHAAALVERGVVIVTIGYRLGVFGFTGHPALSAEGGGSSGEYGMLDQVAALRWVRDNIAAFGGDPQNVTLFGESAGSSDAVALAASPLGRGLFVRLAAQTEPVSALRRGASIAEAEQLGVAVAKAVGCASASDVASCLRSTAAGRLVTASGFRNVAPWVGGAVLPASPLQLLSRTETVPMLLGSDREEAAFLFAGYAVGGQPYTRDAWTHDTNALAGPRNGPKVRVLYPPAVYGSLLGSTVAAYSDAIYTCAIRQLAFASSGAVYRYLYTHVLANDPVAAALHASHFLEEPILWHDGSLIGDYTFIPAEEVLGFQMAGYWTNYAKTGDPNAPGLPVWPAYTRSSVGHIKVIDEPGGQISGYHEAQCDYFDALAAVLGPTRDYLPQGTS